MFILSWDVLDIGCQLIQMADAVQDQEYMIPALDELLAQKKKNEEQKNEFFEKRKQMMMAGSGDARKKELHDILEQRIKEQRELRKKK